LTLSDSSTWNGAILHLPLFRPPFQTRSWQMVYNCLDSDLVCALGWVNVAKIQHVWNLVGLNMVEFHTSNGGKMEACCQPFFMKQPDSTNCRSLKLRKTSERWLLARKGRARVVSSCPSRGRSSIASSRGSSARGAI
jgi:hypothetical protein